MEPRPQDLEQALTLIKFTRRMSAMIDSGINLAYCNFAISKEGLPPYSEFCASLQARWERNEEISLADAMAERADLFSPFYVRTIHWGEIGGVIEESYAHLAEILELTYKWCLRGKRSKWGWFLYPDDQRATQEWHELDERHKLFIWMLFSKSLGHMLAAGVPLLLAISTAAEFLPGTLKEEFQRGSEQYINSYKSWAAYLGETGIVPPFMLTIIAASEAAGRLDACLEKIADTYQKQLECELMY